jgi:hypothetical protein
VKSKGLASRGRLFSFDDLRQIDFPAKRRFPVVSGIFAIAGREGQQLNCEAMGYDIHAAAARHGFSLDAVEVAWESLRRGGGAMAQFDHPELGGHGQWMPGTLMIRDMFNHQLKARVDRLFHDLRDHPQLHGTRSTPGAALSMSYERATANSDSWYPSELGIPATSGAQNDVRYAYFPATRRLAVELFGKLTVYETGDHMISGVSQGQSNNAGSMTFTSQLGVIPLSELKVVR